MAAALNFVQGLEIATLPTLSAASPQANAGYVDAGSLVFFTGNISDQHRSDILDSTLLAQLAADKKYDRFRDAGNWYQFFVTVLMNVGWVVEGFEFHKYSSPGQHVNISNVVVDTLKPSLSSSDLKVAQETIRALESSENWWKVFDSKSYSSEHGNFQMALGTEDSGDVVMYIACFWFTAEPKEDHWFWYQFSTSKVSMMIGTQKSVLIESVYGPLRQTVINKLGGRIKTYIGKLNI
jgi:hypothetical protein